MTRCLLTMGSNECSRCRPEGRVAAAADDGGASSAAFTSASGPASATSCVSKSASMRSILDTNVTPCG
jgi:hypothetical protein